LFTGLVSEVAAGKFATAIAKAASTLTSDERSVCTVKSLRGKRKAHDSSVPGCCRLSAVSDAWYCRHSQGHAKIPIGNP
jgi:hypothetical protein